MSESLKFFPPPVDQRGKPLHAVTITLSNPPTYDPLPKHQTCEEGKVHVYSCPLEKKAISGLIRVFAKVDKDDLSEIESQLSDDITEATDTVLNFECCGSLGSADGFKTVDNDLVMTLVNTVLQTGGLVLFSDFSLKALIKAWKPELWGPVPFVNMGSCSDYVKIRFEPKVLQQCPLGQLKAIGDLCAKSSEDISVAKVHASICTIVYGLSPEAKNTSEYSLQVLTIVTKLANCRYTPDPKDKDKVHRIGEYVGFLGHVLLTFPSGGQILTSAVHWKDLQKMDISMAAMEKVLSKKEASELMAKLDTCKTQKQRQEAVRSKYTKYVSGYSASRKGEYFTITPKVRDTTETPPEKKSGYQKASPAIESDCPGSHYTSGLALVASSSEEEEEEEEEVDAFTTSGRIGIYVSGVALCDST